MPLGEAAKELLRKAKRIGGDAVEALLDSVEQNSRDGPPSEAQKSWDEMQRLRRAGASDEERAAAQKKYRRQSGQPEEE